MTLYYRLVTEVQRGKFVSLGSHSKEKLDPNKC